MHLGAQVLRRSPLKLLDCPFGLAELLGDFANGSLFDKAHHDHATLILWQPIDALRERRAPLRIGHRVVCDFFGWKFSFTRFLLVMIRDRIGGHPIEPRREWRSTPLEALQI